jgi:hypothetical protein
MFSAGFFACDGADTAAKLDDMFASQRRMCIAALIAGLHRHVAKVTQTRWLERVTVVQYEPGAVG